MKKRRNNKRIALMRARMRGREKGCFFCKQKTIPWWREYEKLLEFLSPRGRIIARQFSGVCFKHQKRLAPAIKRARHLGLLPFVVVK